MTGAPEVTVVIPTRDRSEHLRAYGLPAALRQIAVDLEVIVVDDGSANPVAHEIGNLIDERVVVHRHDRPRGVAASRNTGLANARGQWTAFLDDDDMWAPAKLRRQIEVAKAGKCDFAYSSAVLVDGEASSLMRAPAVESLSREILRRDAVPAGGSNIVARTALMRELGGFNERLTTHDDWEMWIRLSRVGKAAACREIHVGYRLHHTSRAMVDGPSRSDLEYIWKTYPASRGTGRPSVDVWLARQQAFTYRRAGQQTLAVREYLRSAWHHLSVGQLLRAVGAVWGERWMTLGSRGMQWTENPPNWLALYPKSPVVARPSDSVLR